MLGNDRAGNVDIKREIINQDSGPDRRDITENFVPLDIELYNIRSLIFLWECSGRNFKVYDKNSVNFFPFMKVLGSAGARFSMRFLI